MLVDPSFNDMFLDSTEKLCTGVFISAFPYNFNHTLDLELTYDQTYPAFYKIYERWDLGSYGVCDDHEQLLDRYKILLDDPDRDYCIGLTEVCKSNEEDGGGWRWHKWGEYIGTQEPTREYIYDEPIIERVFCYTIILLEDRTC